MSLIDTQNTFDALLRRAIVFNQIYDALVVVAEDGTILDWNTGAERLFGWTREEAVGQPAMQVHCPTGPATSGGSILAIVRRVGRWHGELRHVCKDGSAGTCEAVAVSLLDANGEARGTLFVHAENPEFSENTTPTPVDTSETGSPPFHDERFLLRKLVDAVPDPIFCKDREGRYILRNAADVRMFEDFPGADTLGKTVCGIL